MHIIKNSFLVFTFLSFSTIAKANGSIVFKDADVILQQQSELRAYLLQTLCISDSGMAFRVGGDYPMGGARIGPYELYAKPKGQSGPYIFRLVVHTTQTFFDKNDKETVDVTEAVGVNEVLLSAEISSLKTEDRMISPSFNCKK